MAGLLTSKDFWIITIGIIVVAVCLGMVFHIKLPNFLNDTPAIKESSLTAPTENLTLNKIISYEVAKLNELNISNDWECLEYAQYFNKTLSEKYPELDIRVIRYMDICNNLTLCSDYHAFLVVGGYGKLCMLNSKSFDCRGFEI